MQDIVLSSTSSVPGCTDPVPPVQHPAGTGGIHALLSSSRWVPESARWLIASGKLEKAQAYLKTCAKMNRADGFSEALRTEVSPFQIIKTEQRSERSEEHRHIVAGPLLQTLASIVVTEEKGRVYTYLDLVRTPNMRRLAARTGLLWSVFT